MKPNLSIGIPTFNRKLQLRNQLKSLLKQDLSNVYEIIVVDNNSDYNIKELIDEFNTDIIRLIINPFNIKMASNMLSPFLYCKTDWLWLLSDDDLSLKDSIKKITDEINFSPVNTGMIKFELKKKGSKQKITLVDNLNDYIDYYFNEQKIRRGELVFISTNVYNATIIKDYLGYAYEYNYTYIGYLIPIFKALEANKIVVSFSASPIVKYLSPRGDGYSYGKVAKGLSSLTHLPLNLNKKFKKKFLDITMSIPYRTLIINYLNGIDSLEDIKITYYSSYRFYISFKSRVLINLFFLTSSNKLIEKMLKYFYKLFKRLKKY